MADFDVCYLPAQWRAIDPARLKKSACAVIDVIRATSTIVTALANGAKGVQAVASVAEAEAWKAQDATARLAGERGGQPLPGFDLGNSPGDFTAERISGRRVILTTTNGTQALTACAPARAVVVASFLNLAAAAAKLREVGPPWIIVCAGREGHFGVDDAMVAGALAEALECDSPWLSLYRSVREELPQALLGSGAGQEIVRLGLERDIRFCAQRGVFSLAPVLEADGIIR
jgi:2-phosphosulfolactate phosphatase